MTKLLSILISAITIFNAPLLSVDEQNTVYEEVWFNSTDEIRKTLPIEYQAYACGMTVHEFEYLARTIEAESDRTDSLDGKIHICAVILNRVASDRFPNTIQGVLDQDGQFTTTSGGWCSTPYTESSRWSIVLCQREMAQGNIPDNLLFFNCVGFASGFEPYEYIDGNFFSLG